MFINTKSKYYNNVRKKSINNICNNNEYFITKGFDILNFNNNDTIENQYIYYTINISQLYNKLNITNTYDLTNGGFIQDENNKQYFFTNEDVFEIQGNIYLKTKSKNIIKQLNISSQKIQLSEIENIKQYKLLCIGNIVEFENILNNLESQVYDLSLYDFNNNTFKFQKVITFSSDNKQDLYDQLIIKDDDIYIFVENIDYVKIMINDTDIIENIQKSKLIFYINEQLTYKIAKRGLKFVNNKNEYLYTNKIHKKEQYYPIITSDFISLDNSQFVCQHIYGFTYSNDTLCQTIKIPEQCIYIYCPNCKLLNTKIIKDEFLERKKWFIQTVYYINENFDKKYDNLIEHKECKKIKTNLVSVKKNSIQKISFVQNEFYREYKQLSPYYITWLQAIDIFQNYN